MRNDGQRRMRPRHRYLSFAWGVTMTAVMSATVQDESGWRQADPDRVLTFPADHASHPDYRIEWWYYTGHLDAEDGRRFGYQVTFFRVGVEPEPESRSRWAVRDLFITHLAITDIEAGLHHLDERLNREGVRWAGAHTDRLEVWNEDWRLRSEGDEHVLNLESDDGGLGVSLRLSEDRQPTLHGRKGFSQKGTDAGNASHYYSLTRMPTVGRVTVDGRTIDVTGLSWMDHEFGSSFLEPSQRGWDWFSLQLDDGSDLMVYVIRQGDGVPHPRSSGTWVSADGATMPLAVDDFRLTPGRTWTSPTSEARYPVEWRVEVPDIGLVLDVRAELDDQELDTARSTGVIYWEGAVDVSGRRQGRTLGGRGYLEMTGYVGQPMSEVLR